MIKHFGRIIIKHTSTTKPVLHIQKAEKRAVERGAERRVEALPHPAGLRGASGPPPSETSNKGKTRLRL